MDDPEHGKQSHPRDRAADTEGQPRDQPPGLGWQDVPCYGLGDFFPAFLIDMSFMASALQVSGMTWQIDTDATCRNAFKNTGQLTNIASNAFGPISK